MDLTSKKRIIYAAVGIIFLIIISFVIYFYFLPSRETEISTGERGIISRITNIFKGGKEGGVGIEPTTPPPSPPPVASEEQKLLQLTDFSVISPVLNKTEDKILFYKKDGGDLFSYSFSGDTKEKTSNLTIIGILEAFWSPTKDRALVLYLDDETIKGFLHQGTSTITTLPQNIKSAAWSQDAKTLAYLILQNDEINLVLSDSSGKKPKTIFRTPIQDVKTHWITKDLFAFTTNASGLAEGFIFTLNRTSGVFKKIVGPFFGLTSLWSEDGSRVLTSSTNTNGKNTRMRVWDNSGNVLSAIGVKTLAEKCIFANKDEIYCAVPNEIYQDTTLPDDYFSGEFHPQDRLVYIDLKNNETRELLKEGVFDMSNLVITQNKDYLFFVNRFDGTLWRIKLK